MPQIIERKAATVKQSAKAAHDRGDTDLSYYRGFICITHKEVLK